MLAVYLLIFFPSVYRGLLFQHQYFFMENGETDCDARYRKEAAHHLKCFFIIALQPCHDNAIMSRKSVEKRINAIKHESTSWR